MLFQKQDMNGTHYKWEAEGKQHLFTGQPSRRVFDPFNGDQVLFLINLYGSSFDSFSPEEGRKLEQEILYRLPVQVTSEISVLNWMRTYSLNALGPFL